MSEPAEAVTPSALREWPLPRPAGSKHSRGRVVVVGGGPTTPGAAVLGGLAALRVGAGVLSLAVAASVAPAVAALVWEAAVTPLPVLDGHSGPDRLADCLEGADAVLVGPGVDDPAAAEQVTAAVLADSARPVVLDAFALGVLPGLPRPRGPVVLTPNGGEAARLLDADVTDADQQRVAAEIAERYDAVVSYEGVIAGPDGRCWVVPTGHPGLGTSGSGDVLAGAVAGLLARGAPPEQAACWGTYLHASAGDRLAARVGRLGFLARELVDELPLVLVETEA